MLKESIAKFLKLDNLLENVTGYVEARIEILKYDLKEDAAKFFSRLMVWGVAVMSMLFFLFFISTAVAFAIGDKVGLVAGFAAVGGFYVLIAVVIFANRTKIVLRVEREIRLIIKQKK